MVSFGTAKASNPRKFSLRNLGHGVLWHGKSKQSMKVFSAKIALLTNSRKFSPSKLSYYTVCLLCMPKTRRLPTWPLREEGGTFCTAWKGTLCTSAKCPGRSALSLMESTVSLPIIWKTTVTCRSCEALWFHNMAVASL